MFTKLRVKNFKVWGEQIWKEGLELAPVTLLLGGNSAGKTSLLQVPLLLRQTFGSPDRTLDLNLGGSSTDTLDLGTYEEIVHKHEGSRELGLGLTVHEPGKGNRKPSEFEYDVSYCLAAKVPVVHSLRFTERDETYGVTRQSKGGYLLSAPGYEPRQVGNRQDARRAFQPERSLTLPVEALAELGSAGARIQDLALDLRRSMDRIGYLGPLRESPERSYLWGQQTPGSFGPRGEGAVHALLASVNTRKKRKKGKEGGKGWLIENVSGWLKRMGVADSLELERQGRSRHYEVIVTTRGQRANIMDVGFGISQVLPMIVLAYFVPQKSVIIAEQPEIHLHPRAQGGLADLMVEVARERGVQFIIETHSEHVFRRLQYLIADERIGTDECRMYFIERGRRTNSPARACLLQTDEFGRIENWPKHFFGDAVGETERQMRSMIRRLKKTRAQEKVRA